MTDEPDEKYEKYLTAHHEAGHAVAALVCPSGRLISITIDRLLNILNMRETPTSRSTETNRRTSTSPCTPGPGQKGAPMNPGQSRQPRRHRRPRPFIPFLRP